MRDVDSMDCVPKTSGKSKNPRGHLCYIMTQYMPIIFLCPQVPSEAEFRSKGLIALRPPRGV